MKRFSIIKKSYLWVSIAILTATVSLFFFFLNARFSEEFTGGVDVSITSQVDAKTIETKLHNYLDDQ